MNLLFPGKTKMPRALKPKVYSAGLLSTALSCWPRQEANLQKNVTEQGWGKNQVNQCRACKVTNFEVLYLENQYSKTSNTAIIFLIFFLMFISFLANKNWRPTNWCCGREVLLLDWKFPTYKATRLPPPTPRPSLVWVSSRVVAPDRNEWLSLHRGPVSPWEFLYRSRKVLTVAT